MGADPVKLGLVKSLQQAGRNLTGVSVLANDLLAKQIAILHETIAKDATIGFLVKTTNPLADNDIKEATNASEMLGHKALTAKVNAQSEIALAVADLVQNGAAALVIFPDALFAGNLAELAELTISRKLPAIYSFPGFAAAGGLISYGADQSEAYRQAGIYAGRILKGAKPSELPVMQSARFEFIVNLKTAKAIGISSLADTACHRRSGYRIELSLPLMLHLPDIHPALVDVCYRAESGPQPGRSRCRLMTQSGRAARLEWCQICLRLDLDPGQGRDHVLLENALRGGYRSKMQLLNPQPERNRASVRAVHHAGIGVR